MVGDARPGVEEDDAGNRHLMVRLKILIEVGAFSWAVVRDKKSLWPRLPGEEASRE